MSDDNKPVGFLAGITKTPAVNPDGNPISIAVTKLDVRPIIRQNQDLISWRNYTRNAESMVPRRWLLYNLYHDVMLDAKVISVTQKRIDAISTAKWQYVDKDNKPVDAINQLIDSLGFGELLEEIVKSRFWGYSMIDCAVFQDEEGRYQMTAAQFDRRHMRPELGMVTYQQQGDEGFSIREGIYSKTVLEAGKVKDLGLLLSAAQYAILKRGGVSDWATFVEVFGQPILDAEWDGYDEDQRNQLLKAIEEMGNNARLVRPAGTKVQFIANQGNATGQLQNSFVDFLNEEIANALLGSTETSGTASHTTNAIGKVHADEDSKKNESDINFVRRTLNSRFIKILKAFGLPYEGGSFIIPDKKPAIPLTDQVAAYATMANQLGMPIDHDHVYEQSGMPKPKDYDAQIKEKAELKAQAQQIQEKPNKEPANTPPAKGKKTDKKPGNVKLTLGEKLLIQLTDFFA